METKEHPGIIKLTEECAELITVLAKLMAYPDGNHPSDAYSSTNFKLTDHINQEIGDVYAALDFFVVNNDLTETKEIARRRQHKLELFWKWHTENKKGPANV